MRYYCWFCGKSVTTEVPDSTIVRAILVCPECIEDGKITIPEELELKLVEFQDKEEE